MIEDEWRIKETSEDTHPGTVHSTGRRLKSLSSKVQTVSLRSAACSAR
jgi:hypothetical protein